MPASNLMRRSLVVALAFAVGLPVVALAESYTITMRNGAVFHCRQQPQAAPWDAAKVLLRTEVGNWISLSNSDVQSVVSDTENRGFGRTINNTTMMLGEAPNDAPTGDAAAAAGNDEGQQTPYSINQFVEPGKTQGLPGNWIGNSSGGGYSGGSRPAPAPAPRPAPAPAMTPAPPNQ